LIIEDADEWTATTVWMFVNGNELTPLGARVVPEPGRWNWPQFQLISALYRARRFRSRSCPSSKSLPSRPRDEIHAVTPRHASCDGQRRCPCVRWLDTVRPPCVTSSGEHSPARRRPSPPAPSRGAES